MRRYLNLYDDITGAIGQYVKDVKDVDFPNEDESYLTKLATGLNIIYEDNHLVAVNKRPESCPGDKTGDVPCPTTSGVLPEEIQQAWQCFLWRHSSPR